MSVLVLFGACLDETIIVVVALTLMYLSIICTFSQLNMRYL